MKIANISVNSLFSYHWIFFGHRDLDKRPVWGMVVLKTASLPMVQQLVRQEDSNAPFLHESVQMGAWETFHLMIRRKQDTR